MTTPAIAARRIFLGTGLGLLIVSGFLLSMGFLPPTECDSNDSECISTNLFGWLIPIIALVFVICGSLLSYNLSFFEKTFPNTDSVSRQKFHEEILLQEQLEDSKSSNAWTSLEEKLLTKNLEEE
tara:strand:+ start:453 stop:827 length:375 start_codon:yes stop_codon:yes gene_type:complete